MRWLFAYALLATLAACDSPAPSLRDTSAPFVATSRFDPVRFQGDWFDVAMVAEPHLSRPQFLRRYLYLESRNAFVREMFLLRNLRAARENNEIAPGAISVDFITGQGRLRPAGAPEKREWWVLWVDKGYQNAVIAPRSGISAFVLSRQTEIQPTTLMAARKVLKFNGFDVSLLQEVEQ